MLAQNFLTAKELGITEIERDALSKVLGMLERGEIPAKAFNMGKFCGNAGFEVEHAIMNECGTVGCFCGWANYISNGSAFPELSRLYNSADCLMVRLPQSARHTFAMDDGSQSLLTYKIWHNATPESAANALRSYLTTGKDNWSEALRT